MFPTFSGSSRRPRNVDLSGQRNANPWAKSGWAPAQSGASKTVAQAQVEREKRHRERTELAAAKRIQSAWRAHRDRQQVRALRRQEFDALYKSPVLPHNAHERIQQALPLLLAYFVPSQSDDHQRLDWFISDLRSLSKELSLSINSSIFSPSTWDRLARLLVRALEKRHGSSSQTLLAITAEIIEQRPASINSMLELYYASLARLIAEYSHVNPSDEQDQVFVKSVIVPLASKSDSGANGLGLYHTFAYTFLTSSNLSLLQRSPASIARFLDLGALSQSIIHALSERKAPGNVTKDDLLWLLSHFIALNRAVSVSQGSSYLEALYMQMSFLAGDIRYRSNNPPQNGDNTYASDPDGDTEMQNVTPLPEYVVSQLEFLVNEDGIGDLPNRLDSTTSTTNRKYETSLFAGYTLVLLRCFPAHADDIKMRLFLSDIRNADGADHLSLPMIKFFWAAATETNIFTSVVQQASGKEKLGFDVALLKQDSVHDTEWRILLLFLELYNFLLRVSDDEDFLPSETEIPTQQSQTTHRIRTSSLNLEELKVLVTFLKYLAFSLYYDLPDIIRSTLSSGRLGAVTGTSSAKSPTDDAKDIPSTFAGIFGMDVLGLRNVVSSAMHALYQRDSRRPFLPKGFWLMTTKFEMDVFLSAVVIEEMQNEELDEDEEDDTSPPIAYTPYDNSMFIPHQAATRRRLRTNYAGGNRNAIGLKLEVLRNMPFVVPFELRVQIFRQFVYFDKIKRREGNVDPDQWRLAILSGTNREPGRHFLGRHNAIISREKVFDDAFDQFYPLGDGFKEPIQITFVDQFNQPEAGIDGGGVTKEFLTSVANDAFNPKRGDNNTLFVSNDMNLLYPNPSIIDDREAELRSHGFTESSSEWRENMNDILRRYEFLGRIVGKCMYEGILIDISFASFFLLRWASSRQSTSDYRAGINDLRDLDPALYRGLLILKNYTGNVADFDLDFTITDTVWHPSGQRVAITRSLRKDGASIPVTNKDRPLYISYVANHRLVAQQHKQTRAFLQGLGTIINLSWLSMFNQSELQRLIGGDSSEIDVEDLRKNTFYSGLYAIGDDGQEHPTIKFFWDVMRNLKDSERRDVLKYVTSTPRAPLLGFSQLRPQFSIRDGGADEERLPSTSTCVNLLKLPVYSSAQTLRSKLLYAVQSGAGFDLS
ncbi:hypothetical protein GGS21DRAFT_513023 [Xylaria nigripes]|nr:hypothetical protein GGS21DRAFT_513023 [Xylaria nigripes]